MPTKFKEINWNPSPQERRDFGRLLMIGFPFVALFWTAVMAIKGEGWAWNWELFAWIAGIGCGIGLFCRVLPGLARPVYCLWFFLVCIIDTLITGVLLPTFFYLLLFPYGVLVRLAGKASLKKGPEKRDSYWIDVEPAKDTSKYYRQF